MTKPPTRSGPLAISGYKIGGEFEYLGYADLTSDPLGGGWVSFDIWTPMTPGPMWWTWVYLHADLIDREVVAVADQRGETGEILIIGRRHFNDLPEDADINDLDNPADDVNAFLRSAVAALTPAIKVRPADEVFLHSVTADMPGWESPQ